MASSLSSLEDDLTCPVCCEIFREPVVLSCSHSFCRECLRKSWREKEGRECPVCRRTASRDDPPANLVLKNICDSFLKQKKVRTPSGSEGPSCPLHHEKRQLFCVDEEELVCVECVSQHHQNHSLCHISKPARERKENLKTSLRTLEEKLVLFRGTKLTFEKVEAHIKSQTEVTERQIKGEFEKLHQFLREEEEARIAALREEEEQKRQRMKEKIEELDGMMSSLSERIKGIKEKMEEDDAVFLQGHRETMKRAQYTQSAPEMSSGALIDVSTHLGNLRYRVWEKMKDIAPFYPVILDPNSTHESLVLSEDLTSFTTSDTDQELPENPERFEKYPEVLGSEGFCSGKHIWEVEVGDSEDWIIGVAKESVERKVENVGASQEGFWTILLSHANLTLNFMVDQLYLKKL
ncbi:tripartite motif-containing protein 35-like [Chanos chanos]|uniref:Tripartite motif-containing protein 35-like n=1 Tax=Chanos chanos TaxID=29144 RepID=A0A6J2VW46_CHACN|nr:tripartite motif-containing protein 35-like [Chanos chanos]